MSMALRRSAGTQIVCIMTAFVLTGCASWGPSPLAKAQADALEKRQMAGQLEEEKEAPQTAEERLQEGDRFRRQGRDDQALMAYLAAIRMDPSATEPRERIAFVQLGQDVDRAEAIFARLIEEDESNDSAWRGLGLAHLARGELQRSREALERSLELAPDSAGAHYALASVLGLMGQPQAALPHALRARALRPRDALAVNVVGMSYLLLDRPEPAEEMFRQAVRRSPDNPANANNLGLALGAQERYEEAFKAFRRFGDEQSAYNNLGYTYYLNGRYEMAVKQYERALAATGDQDLAVLENLNAAISAMEREVPAAPAGP